ncbi:DUF4352 domain-containing protein [Actinoplanes sp. NPDC049118]|uniref:DUF4352 domain-containing protein n=1 Tax=Actinoplanes sp. NPDC049118 TaxID=3155769 RepID=UPI0033E9053F
MDSIWPVLARYQTVRGLRSRTLAAWGTVKASCSLAADISTEVDCSKTKVGSEHFNEKAQGKFCIVSVNVKNIGKEAQTFSGTSQKAYDAAGTQFSNDTGAEIYANEGSPTFLEEINPGNQVKGSSSSTCRSRRS